MMMRRAALAALLAVQTAHAGHIAIREQLSEREAAPGPGKFRW